MHDPFDRRISFCAAALVKGRIYDDFNCWDKIKTYLNILLKKTEYFQTDKFLYVQLLYRYGIKNNLKVDFGRINKKYGDLPIAVELDMEILMWADKNNIDLLHDIFMIAALEALIQVCNRYKLPKEAIEEERKKFGEIPSSIDVCKKYPIQR
ncbi:MAG: hypothetical protein HEEMFOPI_01770 [Holosporales bacterium]